MQDAPVLSRFEPYEVTILGGVFVMSSTGAALLHRVPPSAERVLPTWGLYLLFVSMAVTSAVALYGIWRGTVSGLNLQRGGSIAMAGLCGSFAAWTLSATGIAGFRLVIFLLMVMVAASWQAARIHRALRPRKASR